MKIKIIIIDIYYPRYIQANLTFFFVFKLLRSPLVEIILLYSVEDPPTQGVSLLWWHLGLQSLTGRDYIVPHGVYSLNRRRAKSQTVAL